ncbi:RNA polymerase factor sigma-54 [Brevundimonas sp. 2R-24]|uniref:RNA polymerase sigma-54 factor n=1 Tax=Peiella sedimenti TaxID=3061083 RepID=A0ABT8SJR4_9CAUL|nr:RNA polymerase factor sigma-54 [Caulobacteraceae bacterium XZ-24]
MALNARLEIRQGQGLVVTPQLQQAIKLLQLSNVELEAFVEAELERNPLLQRDDPEPAETAEAPEAPAASSDELEFSDTSTAKADEAMDAEGDDRFADDPCAGGPPLTDWSRAGSGKATDLDDDAYDRALRRELTLSEHLTLQASQAGFTAAEAGIAQVLIDGLDEGGYLRLDFDETAERLGCSPELIETVLLKCQGFEPCGVFARSVGECLAIQLKDRNRLDPAMQALIDNLELLARRDLSALKRVCGVDDEDLRDMIAELKALTPRPGAAFGGEPAQTVIPDVHVRADPLGGWRVELNSDTLPRLLVDRRYHAQVQAGSRSDADKVFVADCLSQAAWLVKSLDQRAKTILKVASEIVRQQDAFLAFGVEFLRPLNLKTVADAIGMHESTVSRVTSNKYISTPRGVFELKFFFTAAIASADGGAAHSAEAVRHRIKQMVEGEGRDGDVLSDDRIVELLKEAGIDIARRTVAKYREALRIPSSVERKRMLKAG